MLGFNSIAVSLPPPLSGEEMSKTDSLLNQKSFIRYFGLILHSGLPAGQSAGSVKGGQMWGCVPISDLSDSQSVQGVCCAAQLT